MKQALFSNSSKVHDLRSLQSPSTVVPEPPIPAAAVIHPRTAAGNNESHHHPAAKSSVLQAASSRVSPQPHPSSPSPPSQPAPPVRILPKLAPGNLKSMRQSFFDSTRSITERMPSLRSILKDAVATQAEKRRALNTTKSYSEPTRSRAFRGYGSKHLADVGDKNVSYRWVIMPRAPWKVRWDLWIGLIIFYSVVLIPYRIGFGIDVEVTIVVCLVLYWEQVLNYAFDASFAVDVVFNFFTGFYDADIFIHELPKIRERYLKSWFLFDLVSTIPFDQFLQVVSRASSSLLTLKLLRTIRLFRLLKLMRLLRLKRAIDTIQMDALNAHVLQTLKSLLMIVFIIHLVSCGWYLFYTWDPTGMNWVTNLNKEGLAYPYLVSFYWVSNTMMSVGYGDIYGVTDGERIYSIFVECLGSICVGMIIANIQMLTENYNPRGIKLKQKLQETKEFLLKRNIPRRLRQRVLSQFEYHWSRRTVFDEDKLLHQFPVSLQYEILAASMEPFVKRFPFFGVTSVEFFVYTIPRLRPIVLGPGQTLVDAESVWEELYFITSGSIESIRANIIVGSLTPGDICGIEYLVADKKRYTHTYRSSLKTELYAIYSCDIIEAIKKCPIAHKYLMDLATILSERYAESARRGRRAIQKERSLRRVQELPSATSQASEPFLQYRHRKSVSYDSIHSFELDNLRRLNIFTSDEIKTHWSVIRHYSRLRMVWDVLIGVMVAMTAVTVPFRISFDIQDTMFMYTTDRISDICFFLDIALSFLTTYVDETGVEVVDRHEIRRHYLKTNFLVDVVSTIPFDFIVESLTEQRDFRSLRLFRTIKLVKLLRLIRLSKLYKMNMQWTSELDINMDTVRLLKLLAPAMTITHYVGCFWYYMSAQHPKENAWWGRVYFDDPESIVSKYIASVYWAATTMTTVGFGDIIAVNNFEQAYSILVMIGGTTLFAYVVGTVIEVVSNSKSLLNREHELIQKVNAYIKERGVSNEFILACQEHLRFLNAEKTLFYEPGLFDALCYGLRSELILYLNNNVLSKIRFFDKKPKWFLTLVLPRLVPQYFLAGDLLIYHGNPVSGIFFLMSGIVVVKASQPSDMVSAAVNGMSGGEAPFGNQSAASEREAGNIAMLYEGEFFGYKEVLTHALAQYNAFAVKPTGTYLLPREFLETFQADYPHVMDEMKAMIMHSINKQQTIVHHWQNNDVIGIFGEERENFLRRSDRNQFKDSVLPDVAEAAHEERDRKEGEDAPKFGPDDSLDRQLSDASNARYASFLDGMTDSRTRSQGSIIEERCNDEDNNSGSTDQLGDEEEQSRSSCGPSQDVIDGLDSIPDHRPPSAGPRRDSLHSKNRSLFASRSEAGPTLHHYGSVQDIRSCDAKAAAAVGPRRGSVIGIPLSSSIQSHLYTPPPLRRYPSNPAEIDAIVKRLLLVKGYQAPRTNN